MGQKCSVARSYGESGFWTNHFQSPEKTVMSSVSLDVGLDRITRDLENVTLPCTWQVQTTQMQCKIEESSIATLLFGFFDLPFTVPKVVASRLEGTTRVKQTDRWL
jgi:hypothetical protein